MMGQNRFDSYKAHHISLRSMWFRPVILRQVGFGLRARQTCSIPTRLTSPAQTDRRQRPLLRHQPTKRRFHDGISARGDILWSEPHPLIDRELLVRQVLVW
jgi:hypothetical protein